MRIFILEDHTNRVNYFIERFSQHELTITESAFEAVDYLSSQSFDVIFIDNDLGEGNGQGADVAAFLADNPENPNNEAIIIIHSWNMPAAHAMKYQLPNAAILPFNSVEFFDLTSSI